MKKFFASVISFIMAICVSLNTLAYSNGEYITNYDWMNSRSGPGLSYDVTGQLARNSKVNIVQVSSNWGKMENGSWIRLDSGFTTYLGGGNGSTGSSSSYKTGIYSVLYQGTNLRGGPGLSNSVVGVVNAGTQLTVTEVNGEWGKTSYNGKSCWIRLNGFAKYVGAANSGNSSSSGSASQSSASSNQASQMVQKALSHVGYVETTYPNGSFYSIFGAWYSSQIGDSANSFAYQPWCAMYVSYIASEAGVSRSVIPLFASCGVGVNWFKQKGVWHSRNGYTPKQGDIIFFSYDGSSPYHVGIVESCSGGTVYTVEGNVHDGSGYNYGVRKLSYSTGDFRILGYASPNYK